MNERPNIEQIKAELAAAIVRSIEERKLTDIAASYLLTLAPTEVARLRAGDLKTFSIDHLVSLLNALEQRVDLKVTSNIGIESEIAEANKRSAEADPLQSIFEYLERRHAEIPPGELENLPTDLAANHDDYLYGVPKRG